MVGGVAYPGFHFRGRERAGQRESGHVSSLIAPVNQRYSQVQEHSCTHKPDNSTKYYKEKWDEALEISRRDLGPKTFKGLQNWNTCEKLLHDIDQRQVKFNELKIPQLLRRIEPALKPIQKLSSIFVIAMRSTSVVTAGVWGVLYFLIEV
jgi:tRNA nucleotidyltransferase/poly(A) polymerase